MEAVCKEARLKESEMPDGEIRQRVYNTSTEPYPLLRQALGAARETWPLAKAASRIRLEYEKYATEHGIPLPPKREDEQASKEARLLDDVLGAGHFSLEPNPLAGEEAPRPFEKDAFLPTSLPAAASVGAMNVLGLQEPGKGIQEAAAEEATDPVHEGRLRSVQTRAMLSDFMSNDPIISSYDQDDVLAAFNQLSTLAPAVAQQPAVMRGMLRRSLQAENVVEPHEAKQLVDVERGLTPKPLGVTESSTK
jgi:hypothetical protein